MYKHIAKETQLAQSDFDSMKLWMTKLREEKNLQSSPWTTSPLRFAYGFMSPFQRSVYKSNFKQIGLDSTHGTNQYKHELYTIIVRDPCSLSAVPVAFMLTNDCKIKP
ncbi:hypothetical protein BGZ76_007100 [Entomortierella beljakovae]|nr:hypothetical protein BGZ76_007100 [Entomortierella beljakovae]